MGGLLVAGMLPFLGALAILALAPPRSRRAGLLSTCFVAAALVLVVLAIVELGGQPRHGLYPWVPQLGISFSILADGLSLLFALLISGIGLIVFSFATAYLGPTENCRRFFSYLLFFMGAMLGVVLSGNLIAVFVFWELTSVSSFLLIGFWHERERSRDGALKALVVTSTGGLAMLVGFVMIGVVCGSFEIPEIIERRELLLASPWATPAALLVVVGAITKSAQMPFHLWLPSAMEAPTPVSAYLHAATMVKAGLYLVARLGPLLAEVALWTPTLTALGLLTMAWASWLALRQRDLKALLAFSTVSQLGLIMSLLAGCNTEHTSAGLLHLLNHGVFKGALFLLVGVIEHEAHTRDLTELGPLRRTLPRTYALLAVGALSMAGVPPLGGFVSKELFLDSALGLPTVLAAIAVAGAGLTSGYCFALAIGLGAGRASSPGQRGAGSAAIHDPPLALLWGPGVLIALTVLLGLFPQALAGWLVEPATAAATAGPAPHLHLALWHGFTPALGTSALVTTAGIVLYAAWWRRTEPKAPPLWADRIYAAGLRGLELGSARVTAAYMSGLLWRYNAAVVCVVLGGVATALWLYGLPELHPWPARRARAFEYAVTFSAVAATVGTCLARTRLAAIVALGASGYTLALIFSLLGAPDLALTQVMVETIGVALFLAVFVFLPPYRPAEMSRSRPGHLALASLLGFGVAGLLYAARGNRVAPTISKYFVDSSVDLAGGHNVVNVILVDFRGLDTLGEITVLGVAALACFALIKLARTGTVR